MAKMSLAFIGRIFASAMLFWALAQNPYGYFVLLRLVVCFVAAFSASLAHSQQKRQWTWTLGGIAILFNPILPIHLTRGIWSIVDPAVGGILLASIFFVKDKASSKA